jgi:hypothetical protein
MLKHIPFYASLLGQGLYGKNATYSHVLVYGAIEAHSFGEKGCIASNELLAKETGLGRGTVKNVLSDLNKAGWVTSEYKDAHKNIRGKMIPNLTLSVENTKTKTKRPSLRNDTRHSTVTPPSLPNDTPVTGECPEVTVENTVENSIPAHKARGKKTTTFQKDGSDIIKAFEVVNPACKRMYGNTTQRGACDDLIETYGLERTLEVIKILPKTNTIPYVPNITTPAQLRDKWASFETSMLRLKSEHKAKQEKHKVAF